MLVKSGFGQLGGMLLSTTIVLANAGAVMLKQTKTDDSMAKRRSFIEAPPSRRRLRANGARVHTLPDRIFPRTEYSERGKRSVLALAVAEAMTNLVSRLGTLRAGT